MALNQKQLLEVKPESRINSSSSLLIKEKQTDKSTSNIAGDIQANNTGKELEKVVEILLKPEENLQQTPYELLKEERQKRKKLSRNRGMRH